MDIDLAIALLCTHVSKSTAEDWEKLRRVLQYLQHTIELPRIIGMNGMKFMQTYVDALYAIHHDMKGHDTGVGMMTIGHGLVHHKSAK